MADTEKRETIFTAKVVSSIIGVSFFAPLLVFLISAFIDFHDAGSYILISIGIQASFVNLLIFPPLIFYVLKKGTGNIAHCLLVGVISGTVHYMVITILGMVTVNLLNFLIFIGIGGSSGLASWVIISKKGGIPVSKD